MAEGEYSCDFYAIHRVANILLITFVHICRACVVRALAGTVTVRQMLSPQSPSQHVNKPL